MNHLKIVTGAKSVILSQMTTGNLKNMSARKEDNKMMILMTKILLCFKEFIGKTINLINTKFNGFIIISAILAIAVYLAIIITLASRSSS